jgi:hypothetical protein
MLFFNIQSCIKFVSYMIEEFRLLFEVYLLKFQLLL